MSSNSKIEWTEVLGEADAWRISDIKEKRERLVESKRFDFDARIYVDDVAFLLGQIGFLMDLVEVKAEVDDGR